MVNIGTVNIDMVNIGTVNIAMVNIGTVNIDMVNLGIHGHLPLYQPRQAVRAYMKFLVFGPLYVCVSSHMPLYLLRRIMQQAKK